MEVRANRRTILFPIIVCCFRQLLMKHYVKRMLKCVCPWYLGLLCCDPVRDSVTLKISYKSLHIKILPFKTGRGDCRTFWESRVPPHRIKEQDLRTEKSCKMRVVDFFFCKHHSKKGSAAASLNSFCGGISFTHTVNVLIVI